MARERYATEAMPHQERAEVKGIFKNYGLTGTALEQATNAITAEKEAWVRFMMREELGLEEPQGSALASALRIAGAYVVAGFIPLAPYLFDVPVNTALLLSAIVTGIALAGFGAVKGHYTGTPRWRSALETLVVGGAAATLAYVLARAISRGAGVTAH